MRRTGGVLVLILAMLLAACSNETAQPPPAPIPTPQPEPTHFVVGIGDLPPGFNPHLRAHQSPVTTALATLVLPSVFRYDASGQPHLDTTIATSAKVVATEPFTVSYELNLEAAWSTNTPIAAEDFVYLWERMRGDPGVVDAAGYRLITEVRSRAGGKAVDVVFSQPYPQWQRLFADLLPAHLLKDAPGSWVGALAAGLPASGGPFRIITVDPGRGEIKLGRNDLYWDTPTVLDELELRSLDGTGMAAGMASGDVDVALPDADPAVRTALGGLLPPPHLQSAPQPTVTELVLRTDGGPLSDPRVRLAIASLVDRAALRSSVAPEALAADAFGLAPSQAGYAATAPASLAKPDPSAAAQLLAAAGWSRDLVTGRWNVAGSPARLVIGAAAERDEDLLVARALAKQLDAAGIGVTLVAPTAVELFGQATVPPTPPSSTPTPTPSVTPTPAAAPTTSAAASGAAAATPTTPSTTTTTAPPSAAAGVAVDLMVAPRTAGGDVGSELASDFGCPPATTLVPDPPRSPTRLCSSTLQPLLDELVRANPRPETAAEVERILWQQLPALPLFQPVTLVTSTAASDAVTGIGPGPIGSGPVTGAERWRPLPN